MKTRRVVYHIPGISFILFNIIVAPASSGPKGKDTSIVAGYFTGYNITSSNFLR